MRRPQTIPYPAASSCALRKSEMCSSSACKLLVTPHPHLRIILLVSCPLINEQYLQWPGEKARFSGDSARGHLASTPLRTEAIPIPARAANVDVPREWHISSNNTVICLERQVTLGLRVCN